MRKPLHCHYCERAPEFQAGALWADLLRPHSARGQKRLILALRRDYCLSDWQANVLFEYFNLAEA